MFRNGVVAGIAEIAKFLSQDAQKLARSIMGGQSVRDIELARRYLQIALAKIESGDYRSKRDIVGIIRILETVPEFYNYELIERLSALAGEPAPRDEESLTYPAPTSQRDFLTIASNFRAAFITAKVQEGRAEIKTRESDARISTFNFISGPSYRPNYVVFQHQIY